MEEEGGGVRKEKNWGRGDWHCRTGERERARAGGGRGWRKTEKECRGRKSECQERMMEKWKEKEDEGGGKDRREAGKVEGGRHKARESRED